MTSGETPDLPYSALPLDPLLCAREPIHSPGAIQPHGALIAARHHTMRVTHASANLAAILGVEAESVLGRSLGEVLGEEAARQAKRGETARVSGPALPDSRGGVLHLCSYRTGQHICIDIEPEAHDAGVPASLGAAQGVLDGLDHAADPLDLCGRAVRGLATISGYDRVMAYRFHSDGHGEVIAEARQPGLDAFLGLHYPASDVPPQARRLYLSQRVGSIADAAYVPVPLLAEPDGEAGTALDLTASALRSVSPIHRDYMRNMKTAASLTIALVHRDSLWGLLVCHHATARIAGPNLRALGRLIGHVVSMLITSLLEARRHSLRLDRNAALRRVVGNLASGTAPLEALAAAELDLLGLVEAEGAIVRLSGRSLALGRIPAPAEAERALARLATAEDEVQAIDDLGRRHPDLAACAARGSGALLLRPRQSDDDAILWFRPEIEQTVTWGGDPNDHGTFDRQTGTLRPRASFAAWKETMRGRSLPWQEIDLDMAHELAREIEVTAARRSKADHDRLAAIVEWSEDAIYGTTLAGILTSWNRGAEKLFGYSAAEAIGRAHVMLLPERQVAEAEQILARLVEDGPVEPFETVLRHKSGRDLEVSMTLSVVRDIAGEIEGACFIVRDIGELKRQADEIKRSNLALEQFAYVASHDLQEPLRMIANYTELLAKRYKGHIDERADKYIHYVVDGVRRMQLLINGILTYSRVGSQGKALVAVVSGAVLRDALKALRSVVEESGATIAYGDMPRVLADEIQLGQLFQNLIGNAIKFRGGAPPKITLAAQREGDYWLFSVADNGIGLDLRHASRIFEMFQRLHEQGRYEGSGIGLAVAKQIVDRHGGRIWVDSQPGCGATFYFTLRSAGGEAE